MRDEEEERKREHREKDLEQVRRTREKKYMFLFRICFLLRERIANQSRSRGGSEERALKNQKTTERVLQVEQKHLVAMTTH